MSNSPSPLLALLNTFAGVVCPSQQPKPGKQISVNNKNTDSKMINPSAVDVGNLHRYQATTNTLNFFRQQGKIKIK